MDIVFKSTSEAKAFLDTYREHEALASFKPANIDQLICSSQWQPLHSILKHLHENPPNVNDSDHFEIEFLNELKPVKGAKNIGLLIDAFRSR